MSISNLRLETKQSKNPLIASIYGLVAEEVNLIRDTINEIIAAVNLLDVSGASEIWAHKVDVSESQDFTDNEKTQGRENIGSAFRKLYSADILSTDLDTMLTSGFYEGTFTVGQEVNEQTVLRLLVFAKSITSCTQVQFSTATKIWIRQGTYADSTWTWSTWTVIADDLLANYLSTEPQEFSEEQISQLLGNLHILSDVNGYTYKGFEYPTSTPIPKEDTGKVFYFANFIGEYDQFNLKIDDPGLYIISNTNGSNAWTLSAVSQSIISVSVGSLQTMASQATLIPGQLYRITDHGNDKGILVQAATTTTLFPNGIRNGLVPAHYMPGTYDLEPWEGVWDSTTPVTKDARKIFCGRVWFNLTGNIGTVSNSWSLDAVNWVLDPVVEGSSYIQQIFNITYNLTNDYILKQWDEKGNEFGEAIPPIDNFLVEYNDWATNCQLFNNKLKRCYNNKAIGGAAIYDNAGTGSIYGNDLSTQVLWELSEIYANRLLSGGDISGNTVANSSISYNELRGVNVQIGNNTMMDSTGISYNIFDYSMTGCLDCNMTETRTIGYLLNVNFNGFLITKAVINEREDITLTDNLYVREDLIPMSFGDTPLGTEISQFSNTFSRIVSTQKVKTDATTPTDFHVETGAAKTLVLDTPVYADINVPISSGPQPAANMPTWTTFTTNTSSYTFAIEDYKDMGTIEIPHNYKEGTDLEVHLHIANNGQDSTARTCLYQIYYTYGIPDNGTNQFIAEVTLTGTLTIPANTPTRSAFYLSMGTITGTNIKIGTQLKMRVERGLPQSGTAPTANPFLGQVGVHYQIDTMGSRQISTK